MEEKERKIRFTYHAPIGNQQQRYESIRSVVYHVAQLIDVLCNDSREKSLALTKLDEVVFYTNAAIARRG